MSESNGSGPESGSGESFEVFPGLVSVQWRTEQVTLLNPEGEDPMLCVMLELRTPTGMHITFWPEDTAVVIGERLLELGRATGLGQNVGGPVSAEDG